MAIHIQNSTSFDSLKAISDKQERYIIAKGRLEHEEITLINVYAPLDSDKQFFKSLFTIIATESESIVICRRDFSVIIT